ncbi:hypothetical protein THIOSC15_2680006 [uncultured Thiomicrorhabdus sp.]
MFVLSGKSLAEKGRTDACAVHHFERFMSDIRQLLAKQQQATKQRQGSEFFWLGEKRLIDGALEQLESQ